MLLIIFLLWAAPLSAQSAPTNTQVGIGVNFSTLEFGKPFRVDYTVPAPVTEILSVDTNTQEAGRTVISSLSVTGLTFRIEAASYSPQAYDFPSLLVTALDAQSNTNLFYTPSFTVPLSNTVQTNKLSLIDIVPPPFIWNHLWTILIGLLLLAALAIVFLARRKRPVSVPAPNPDTPFQLILKRLNALKAQKDLLTEESYKAFFVELSETVRDLLSHTAVPVALESPTKEIIEALKKRRLSLANREAAELVLRTCDAAKYAKAVFPQERTNDALEAAFTLLRHIPRPEGPKKDKK